MSGCVRVSVVSYPDRDKYVLRWTDPVTGKKRTKTSEHQNDGRKRSRSLAEKEAGQLQGELEAGLVPHRKRTTWTDFVERFIADVSTRRRVRTVQAYENALESFGRVIRPSHLDVVTGDEIKEYRKKLNKVSESTVRSYLRHLKASLRWAVREGLIRNAPDFNTARSTALVDDEAKGRPLSEDEFEAMLEAIEHVIQPTNEKHRKPIEQSWRFMLRGLRLSGLRIGEACALTWDDPTDAQIIRDSQGRLAISIPSHRSKNGRRQTVPVTPTFERFLEAVPKENRVGHVFQVIRNDGRKWSMKNPNAIGKRISAFGKEALIIVKERDGKRKFASAHDLRRTFGKEWALKVQPAVLQKLMRHGNIHTTMTYYALLESETIADELWKLESKGNKTSNRPPIEVAQRKSLTTQTQVNHGLRSSEAMPPLGLEPRTY